MQNQQKQIRYQIKILNATIYDFNSILSIEKDLKLPTTNFKLFSNLIELDKIFVVKVIPSNQLIGFVELQGDLEETEIITLGVKKNFQNQGYGKQLINFIIKKNYKNIFLEVSLSNLKALNFYKSLGFKRISIRKNYYRSVKNQNDAFILNYKNCLTKF